EGIECLLYVHYGVGAGVSTSVEDVVVSSDVLACRGTGCGVYGLFGGESPGAVSLADVTLDGNQLRCEGNECGVGLLTGWRGVPLSSVRTEVTQTLSGCSGDRCQVAALVDLESTGDTSVGEATIHANAVGCSGESCRTNEVLFAEVHDGGLSL